MYRGPGSLLWHQDSKTQLANKCILSQVLKLLNRRTRTEVYIFFLLFQAVPPLEVSDLMEEIRDGHVLLSLLEVLLGKTLVSPFIDHVWLFPSSGDK